MADATDPGGYEWRAEQQVERVKKQVRDENQTDILQTIRRGRRGEIESPKPNQEKKDAWEAGTVRNNARNLRILAGETEGLDEAKAEGKSEELEWDGMEGRGDHPDRLLDFEDAEQINKYIEELSIERGWGTMTERDYCMSIRNHLLAHDRKDTAKAIRYPQTDHDSAAVSVDTVLTREDLMALIDEESVRDQALLTVLWESGNRVTALCALKIKHWMPRGDSYGLLRIPGEHVTGLKGADHSVKPISFSRGYLDKWLAEHPLADDDDAPLFCSTRSQDDPSQHLNPHSICVHLKRIAR